jgi:DNA-binding transcriptional MerR regulator
MSAPARTRIAALVVSPAPEQLPLDAVAQRAGLHPELVRRLVALGALEPIAGTRAAPRFSAEAAARLTVLLRLRRDLGLNWAGTLLALDLLDRIDLLQARLARYEHPTERGR